MWDGRAASLEEQVLLPVQDPVEMHTDIATMVAHIKEIPGYQSYFQAAFGKKDITAEGIQYAIATFERVINSYPIKFDSFVIVN
jgi:cytochrome c peroxidase